MILNKKNKIQMKNRRRHNRQQTDYPDYHITGPDDDSLIDLKNGSLDDIESFNCSMYNFGDMENLPDSDRAMIADNQTCREYKT